MDSARAFRVRYLDFVMLTSQHLMAALVLLIGCAEPPDRPVIVVNGDGFFGDPWPSDRRTTNGNPDMDGFPGTDRFDIVETYVKGIENLSGFGTNSALFVRFDRPIPEADLPDPNETMRTTSPYFLVDIDPVSPDRGRLIPLMSRFQTDETLWQDENLLALQPVLGFPLRPLNTYALVFRTEFTARTKAMASAWEPGTTNYAYFKDLTSTLFELGIDSASVAHATRFTTQDPVMEMALFEDRIAEDLSMPPLDQALTRIFRSEFFTSYRGEMWVPMWQHGDKPYLSSGGAFAFDDEGRPMLHSWDRIDFTISVPNDQQMPEEGWPVVIYAHGTGGAHYNYANDFDPLEPANVLGSAGIMGFGISLPLHGDRATSIDPGLASFNYLNPDSARAVFRQAALDHIYLAEALSTRAHNFTLSADITIKNDPQRMAYLGHSHGGLIGAIAAPFMDDRLKAMVLSGAGGGLSTTITTRDAGDFDIQQLLTATLEFDEDEALEISHPIIAAVQTLAEVTDPINYAPYWHQRQPYWETSNMPVLMTEGLDDVQTPPPTAEALAAAGGLPILEPVQQVSGGHGYRGTPTASTPAMGNIETWNNGQITGGLAQYADADHFVIFRDEQAASLYLHFLTTALDDAPEIPQR